MTHSLALRAGVLSLLLLALLLGAWHLATLSAAPAAVAAGPALTPEQIEYAKLMGKDPTAGAAAAPAKSGFPTLAQRGAVIAKNLASPCYDNGPNDTGVGLQPSGQQRTGDGLGTGLSTLRERLKLTFGGDAQLRLTEMQPHGVCAELDFPARQETA